jgi:hypothetical protein
MSDRQITAEQRAELRALKVQAVALVERMNAILRDLERRYRMDLHTIGTGLPMVIADDADAEAVESDPRYLPDVSGRRIGSERGEREEDEGAPIPADDDGEDA